MPTTLPLSGFRVIDLTDGVAGVTGRFLADMGADVILVEPPDGVASRRQQPVHQGHSLRFATTHFNKRGIVLDLTTAAAREDLLRLAQGADLVLESLPAGRLAELGVGYQQLRARNPALVVASITEFGQTGPYRDWTGSGQVLTAMSSALTRSGAPDREPLMPPGELATQTAAIHAGFAALLALYQAQRTGQGDYVDCSLFDLAVQDLDPGFGMGGSASMGQPQKDSPPGRPDRRMLYPIVPCADGHVRMFIASGKQWRALFGWMGEPAEVADPSYEQIFTRFMNWEKIRTGVVELFAGQNRDDIVRRATELGIAVAALQTPQEILASEHVRQRNSFARVEVAPGVIGDMANGYVEFGHQRAGFRCRAPRLGEHTDDVLCEPLRTRQTVPGDGSARPLEGIRVLDLGVIVVGGETGRSLADQGADVIKVESRDFIDGVRQFDGDNCSYTSAIGLRGKRSLGLNLRSDTGTEIFRQLVAKSDVVLSNFKPGTLESLGLGYENLRAINPEIIVIESSALGSTGPWSRQMGYGPLVRGTVGLTDLWRHPDSSEAFGDDMTVYPDHAASRIGITAVLAALISRQRGRGGCKISLAQMETIFSQLATDYLRESLQPGSMIARGNSDEFDAPSGVYACSGEDAYCVIDVRNDDQWARLAEAMGRPDLAANPAYLTASGRVTHRDQLDAAVSAWTSTLSHHEVQDRLQSVGVPAGAAAHVRDLLVNPQLEFRRQLGALQQPGFPEPLEVELGPALFENIPEPELRPAPLMAADTRAICRELLAMTDSRIDELVAAGVLEVRSE
ncbi:Acyl-CoA transferase/dehydratase [uncultured Mycobacterium sp.]|uniref:Acyl-CoA transferase/dehydratase n=1 Tax=uncultured Mycobacterium sp. TaxID=171292 RepID=A0A1Y5PK72_9MYCO|nr:Acyl-CoA transferase/dehydratase [uncultured Mycobacterium sp.]